MKNLNFEEMESCEGGNNWIKSIGIASCIGAAIWPIGTAIFGPTCGGMLIAAAVM